MLRQSILMILTFLLTTQIIEEYNPNKKRKTLTVFDDLSIYLIIT